MVNTILTKEAGNISYNFYDTSRGEETQINAVPGTAFIGPEKEWRVVLTDNVPKSAGTGETNVTVEELKSFVENAYVYATKVGKTEALAAFNKQTGDFIDGELYIFAYDMNGTVLALPHQPDLIGEKPLVSAGYYRNQVYSANDCPGKPWRRFCPFPVRKPGK